MERPVGHGLGDKRVQAWLCHRAAAGPDLVNLGRRDVNSPDVVAARRQAGCRYCPDITKTEYCHLHGLPHRELDSHGTDMHTSSEQGVVIRAIRLSPDITVRI